MTEPRSDALAALPESERDRVKAARPRAGRAMLAVLSHEHFSDARWLYERKLDGERVLAVKDGADVRLVSRNDRSVRGSYPEIADQLAAQGRESFVVDGEVVAFDRGLASFARLQPRMHTDDPDRARASGVPVFYYVFDLLHVDGADVTRVPLRRRKALLRETLRFERALRFTAHRNGSGERFLAQACRWGWEGLIAKRADGPYVHGRSSDWLKFKCVSEQELVIGGFTEPAGSRVGFGALLVGHYRHGRLRYAGKVGTGYDQRTLVDLRRRLDRLGTDRSPFHDHRESARGVHWVEPELVAEIGFTEWTADGRLRHPRFQGLRRDKKPEDVVRE